jgi:NAD(P)H dehydrogenase (quinone)
MSILITGATGQLGTAVIETLLTQLPANQIFGLVRDENKAAYLKEKGITLRIGDYSDTASLDRAMEGIDKVLLISGGGSPDGLQEHFNVVDAAKKAGVACVAYTGRALANRDTLANELMKRHFQTEDYIKASGMNYVLFRNILYMDTIPVYTGGAKVFETGINLPAGDGKVAYALRSEMGEAMANVLAQDSCENQIYHFTGAEAYTYADVATALTQLSGKPITYTAVAPEAYQTALEERGLPAPVIQLFGGFMIDIKNGQEADIYPDLEQALGRKPATLTEGLKVLFKL